MDKDQEVRQLIRLLRKKTKRRRRPVPTANLLSTGSTLLNLLCSGRVEGAYYKGGFFHLVGGSDSGKSMLGRTAFAEAAQNKRFKDHRLIDDNPEGGGLMDTVDFFGASTARRIEEPPFGTSQWVEDVYYNLDELYSDDRPFIYLLDSMDSIDSQADDKHFKAKKKTRWSAKDDSSGSFAMFKPKLNMEGLRRARYRLEKTGSILIIISHERDNVGNKMSFGPTKTYSGGRALKYFSRLQIWTASVKTLYKTVNEKKHQVGIVCQSRVAKNHITGQKGRVEFPIYNSYGVDDLASCVDYLVDNSHWGKPKNTIVAEELEIRATKDKLLRMIEDNEQEEQVRQIVGGVWKDIVLACRLQRKKRYD